MAQLMEYADYLSKEIGPRPAGTEEEQQAALYITERFQKDSGFSAQIEEFTSSSNVGFLVAVPGLVTIIAAILGMVFPMLTIPAFILAAASAALYALESFGHPIVTRALARGASQNVVARYQPNYDADMRKGARTRKIVLVAHYDSGKVTPSLVRRVESLKLPVSFGLVVVCGYIAAAFFLLLHVFLNAGIGAIVLNVLIVISLVLCAWPILRTLLYQRAPYNEGANNNATGTAALIEVARRISRGSVSEADLAECANAGVRIHGEDAARESGLVPEGAQIVYEAEQLVPPAELGEYDEEERLLAAKAAIAAMTGQSVEPRVYGSVADKLVNSRARAEEPAPDTVAAGEAEPEENAALDGEAALGTPAADEGAEHNEAAPEAAYAPVPEPAPAPAPAPEPSAAEGFENAPSWFIAAQQNAKKPTGETGPIQRSRYAEAIEAAEREAAARERERAEQERLQREAELRTREEAAWAAIAASAAEAEREIRVEEAPAEAAAPAGEQPSEPVFVPYDAARVSSEAPAEDDFAASLGATTAFDPHLLQDATDAADSAQEPDSDIDRLAGLPAIDAPKPEEEAAADEGAQAPAQAPAQQDVPETTSPSRSGLIRKLRTDVPSMSGVIRMQAAGQDVSQLPVQQPAPAPAPEPEPVADAPAVATPDPEPAPVAETIDYDMVPSEFDDMAEYYDDRGFYTGRDSEPSAHVDVPKSRAGGLFGRFRRKNREELEETPQEWLNVDEDFDARTVGRERGGWESFRSDDYDDLDNLDSNGGQGRRWEGGAYSRVRLGHVDTRSGEDTDISDFDDQLIDEEDRQIADEIEQIYHFRNPLYNTEIWFVALGSDCASHDGAKAFLAEHADELRGSMIIEVESLGVGELCVASTEGRMRKVQASSRVKRFTRAATAATGIAPGSVDLSGYDSAASIMQAAGFQTMHLLGVEDGRPALKGSPDDILENVDDLLLDDNVNFLMELLKK